MLGKWQSLLPAGLGLQDALSCRHRLMLLITLSPSTRLSHLAQGLARARCSLGQAYSEARPRSGVLRRRSFRQSLEAVAYLEMVQMTVDAAGTAIQKMAPEGVART